MCGILSLLRMVSDFGEIDENVVMSKRLMKDHKYTYQKLDIVLLILSGMSLTKPLYRGILGLR
ncbi:hypothetical protein HC024_08455 [Methylococcaceae bacterium WWC4]|nr:hypothetical protein [Methylococcaceae bacterium WWC4]